MWDFSAINWASQLMSGFVGLILFVLGIILGTIATNQRNAAERITAERRVSEISQAVVYYEKRSIETKAASEKLSQDSEDYASNMLQKAIDINPVIGFGLWAMIRQETAISWLEHSLYVNTAEILRQLLNSERQEAQT